jgi:hypothetical protein
VTDAHTERLTRAERKAILADCITDWIGAGWRVETQSDYQVVIVRGHRPNHILHLFLSIFTLGLWAVFVWLPLTLFGGEKRKTITVDEYGTRLVH